MRCLPIPDLALPAGLPDRGWKKLTTFEADLHGLRGTALFLDIDIVIVDDITPFFELPGEFLIIHDWKRPWRVTGNSSVYRFELGAHADVLANFRAEHGRDARAIPQRAGLPLGRAARAGQAAVLAEGLVRELQVPQHRRPSRSTTSSRPSIPKGARIIVFHGVMNPPDALAGRSNGNWRHAKATPWISDHWKE